MDRRALIDEFRAYLRERDLPVTPQRLAVAELLLLRDRHFSAEELERELAREGVKVSTATVYRAIETLVKSGLVVERDFGEGFRRYESARDMPHHEHVLCTSCGKVVEFRDERLERMAAELAASKGYVRQSHRLVIYGLCDACRAGRPGRP
ncbi:MAG TPA: Fur family transcriptional regulator [Gemmatimonadaceae bacterium]|nr:Fur family transcriptional regulator [Gemmatimonadaceae bacterium]